MSGNLLAALANDRGAPNGFYEHIEPFTSQGKALRSRFQPSIERSLDRLRIC
jgi:hypothetical protein